MHECEFCKSSQMKDVTEINHNFYCRRCGEFIPDEFVDKNIKHKERHENWKPTIWKKKSS